MASASSTQTETTPKDEPHQQDEGKIFDQTTAKGLPNGLFQASMKVIRKAHFQANRIRAFLTLTGLFTDKPIYRNVIAIFYLLTKELETKLEYYAKKGDAVALKIRALGYHFSQGYEQDLKFLYDNDENWKEHAQQTLQKNAAAVEYLQKLQHAATSQELAGAAFVLWGALIIGGGAVAMPRVKSAFGEEATHLYQPVVGPGRDQRKREFIQCWDSLVEPKPNNNSNNNDNNSSSSSSDDDFGKMVQASQEFMQGNNNVLSTLAQNPWWLPYATTSVVGVLSMAVYFVRRRYTV